MVNGVIRVPAPEAGIAYGIPSLDSIRGYAIVWYKEVNPAALTDAIST